MTTHSPAPRHARAALVGFDIASPLPRVVVFQYNPETVSRSLKTRGGRDEGGPAEPMRLLGLSMLVAALRFAIIGGTDGHWSWVLASQLMHAITFGVHHSAAMAMLHRAFEPGAQGRAQGLYATLGYGAGGAAGTLVAGWVWSAVSPQATFLVAAAAALLGAFAVAACLRLDYPRRS